MALFTDGPISTILDLQNYESGVLAVASTAGIDLTGKMRLAQDELSSEILLFLLRRSPFPEGQRAQRRARGVEDVVVTGALKQWHVHKTLELVYRDVYNSQVNDRYVGKWQEYEQLSQISSDTYFQVGVGIVANPLPKPSSVLLSTVAGDGAAANYYVLATWVNGTGQESSPSDMGQISIADGAQLMIALAEPPAAASGWNAYLGETPTAVFLQNESLIAVNSNWTLTGSLAQGRQPGKGQQPTWFLVDHRVIERG